MTTFQLITEEQHPVQGSQEHHPPSPYPLLQLLIDPQLQGAELDQRELAFLYILKPRLFLVKIQ
jgi:hypothetical protein